jgi:hypothetical protein
VGDTETGGRNGDGADKGVEDVDKGIDEVVEGGALQGVVGNGDDRRGDSICGLKHSQTALAKMETRESEKIFSNKSFISSLFTLVS